MACYISSSIGFVYVLGYDEQKNWEICLCKLGVVSVGSFFCVLLYVCVRVYGAMGGCNAWLRFFAGVYVCSF